MKIPYEVPAGTAYEAIHKATDLLRTGVRLRRVGRVTATVPGWYEVVLSVDEPESADPMTSAKGGGFTVPVSYERCAGCGHRRDDYGGCDGCEADKEAGTYAG